MDKKQLAKIEKLEKQLAKVCEDVYLANTKGRRIIPLHPWILVRVLPKEHRTSSGLYIPGNVTNKPLYESIVLETWRPYDETRIMKDENGKEREYIIHHVSELKRGDRIIHPHFEGQALPEYLDEKYYRMVRQGADQDKWPYCGVWGTMDYEGDASIVEDMKELMTKFSSITLSGAKPGPGVPDWEPPAKADWFTS